MVKIKRFGEKGFNYDFNKIKAEFDNVVLALHEVVDKYTFYRIDFTTQCGYSIHMTYQDYLEKNNKYDMFIESLPIMGEFFQIKFWMDRGIKRTDIYDCLVDIADSMSPVVNRIEDLDWHFKSFKINHSDDSYAVSNLEYAFERDTHTNFFIKPQFV